MIKILFIHQSADLYGSDRTLLLLLRHIDRQKFDPVVVVPLHGPLLAELEKLGIKVVVSPVIKLYRGMFSPSNLMGVLRQLRQAFKSLDKLHEEHHFDIIYSNTLAVLLGMMYASRRKIKHIWHVHEIIAFPKWAAWLFPRLLNKFADVVVCNSQATLQNNIGRVRDLKKKSIVIYNGHETQENSGLENAKAAFGFSESDVVVTLVGRIYRLKGHLFTLSAFASRLAHNHDLKLLFIGSAVTGQEHYLENVRKTVSGYGLEDRVTILPFTPDLDEVWRATDIAIMPSTEPESFGLVALEAMFAAKPVVASAHGGLLEIVENGKTGILFPPGDEQAFADAVLLLASDVEKRHESGKAGRERAQSLFGVENYVKAFESLFIEVGGQKTPN